MMTFDDILDYLQCHDQVLKVVTVGRHSAQEEGDIVPVHCVTSDDGR